MTNVTSFKENEWFKKNEVQLLKDRQRQRERALRDRVSREKEKQHEALKTLHWMHCPKCGHAMETTDIEGIEVDICSFCEGIYFDHGELEELLMRKQDNRFRFYRRFFGLDL